MFKNYFTIAFRNIRKQKAYSAITLSGLILGLAVFIIFALLVEFIANYDMFHEKVDRLYAVVQVLPGGAEGEQHSAITPAPFLPALLDEFPEIESGSRFYPAGRKIVKHGDKVFYESRLRFVDPSFLTMFSFKMVKGDPETALSDPVAVVMTEAMALKYFGDEDPIGKSLTLDNEIELRVTGVTEDVPPDSSLSYQFLVSLEASKAFASWRNDWRENNQATFLLLAEGYDPAHLEAKFSGIIDKYFTDSPDSPHRLYLHPLKDFFLNSQDIDVYWGNGGANFPVLWIVAALLLVIACFNYMNLSTARHVTRAREVGMRKVIGANRSHLIRQFLGESLLMSLLALPAAILVYELLRPAFMAYIDDFLNLSLWDSPQILLLIGVVTVLTGLFAGSYPAFYLSAFRPVRVLKGELKFAKKGGRFRKTLVVAQFVFSIILIVMTIVSVKQARHNRTVDLGFDRSNILALEIAGEARDNLESLEQVLIQHKDVTAVTAAASVPIGWDAQQLVLPEGVVEEEKINMNVYGVGYNFIEMMDLALVEGRSFSREFSSTSDLIINETAVRRLQWEKPLGKRLKLDGLEGTVIGVVKDFHFKDLYFSDILPSVLCIEPDEFNYMLIKYSEPDSFAGVMEYVKQQWEALNPHLPLEHMTLNSYFNEALEGDKTAGMTGALGLMAIFLSCLGLLGLSSFAVERKFKEIGIRKVLGASAGGIIAMLIKEFLKLVVIANLIAIPIAYFTMSSFIRFLFSYPMSIGLDIFIFTAFITLLVAFITVTSQTLKAAHADPVKCLKYE
jgi:putative ABC transport system permease protein